MKTSTICPCCSTPLLHHFGNHREYWFCRHCWQEMPSLEIDRHEDKTEANTVNHSARLPIPDRMLVAI